MIKEHLKRRKINKLWRSKNKHNSTTIVLYDNNVKSLDNVHVGRYTYGEIKPFIFSKDYHLRIGSFCSIAPNVCFVVSGDHHLDHLTSFPFYSKCIDGRSEAISKGDIVIEDDVWIGVNATILSGVKIAQGAVVAAGAVVTKDVPPYAIVGGNPAKVIKYRFDEATIKKLLKIDFDKIDDEYIKNNLDSLYEKIDSKNVDILLKDISKKGE